ncbi:phenylacetate-CoA ligase [Wenyingzhuangia heitensis]|uniref:Phenylacetate-CoA ligase n=1 Tax=Wenyingzhuangia heitensis TaxID=1487859 RepID=A0ABX0UD96_9FLAO|nr:phenylacetate-CoA ligase [Wenyingzhuangia heitensis]
MHKIIYKIGVKTRNPSLNKWISFLNKTQSWSIDELESYQLKKLKELLLFAYQYSPFYKEYFDKNNVDLKEIKSLDDITKIPILEKQTLLNNINEIHTKYVFKKTLKAITSGTTGKSLSFLREESADSFNRASIFRGYSWYGIKPWDRNAYFWGFNFSLKDKIKTRFLDFIQNRFRVFSYNKKSFLPFIKRLKKVKYIHGYSSMLYQTAKLINEQKLETPQKLKMIKGTSEKIFEVYQEEVQKAFGLKMISEYGATESGIIAFECPEGNMHINMEGCLVEEIEGEVIVTNLQMKSFPIIRYKLGDYIELAPKNNTCSCGKEHRILNDITGRVGENVYGKNEIYPSFSFYYIFKNILKNDNLKLSYQVLQNNKGFLEFKIGQELTPKELTIVNNEIKKYFKEDIDVTIKDKVKFDNSKGKFKSFISTL